MQKIALSTPELDILAFKAFQNQTPVTLPTFRNEEQDEDKAKLNTWANSISKPIKSEEMADDYKFVPSLLSRNGINSILFNIYTHYYNLNIFVDNPSNDQISVNQDALEPIDMADQERIKLERKRYRNRIAASKCRQRKLERISKLQDRVSRLAAKNDDLTKYMNAVQDIINRFNNHIMKHKESGCDIHEMQF